MWKTKRRNVFAQRLGVDIRVDIYVPKIFNGTFSNIDTPHCVFSDYKDLVPGFDVHILHEKRIYGRKGRCYGYCFEYQNRGTLIKFFNKDCVYSIMVHENYYPIYEHFYNNYKEAKKEYVKTIVEYEQTGKIQ